MMIGEKKEAPEVFLKNRQNNIISLHNYRGKRVYLVFIPDILIMQGYVHAIELSNFIEDFDKLDTIVLAICGNCVDEIESVCKRLNLKLLILSDENCVVREAYGVWVKKVTFGKEYMITSRSAFLINEKGIIERVYKRAKRGSNAQIVLNYVKHMKEKEAWRRLSRRAKERIRREQKESMPNDDIKSNDEKTEYILL